MALQAWIAQHKLTSIGAFWASAVGASFAYNGARTPVLKPSLRLIHARMHAQALTLAMLSSAAMLHYYSNASHADAYTGGKHKSNSNTESSCSLSLDEEEERLSYWF